MALNDYLLDYTKDWRNPEDFPTYETREAKVREDMQLLFNEMREAFNRFIVDLSAGLVPFSSSEAVPADDVQEAIENVQQQLSDVVIGEITVPNRSLTASKLVEHTLTGTELGEGCVGAAALATDAVETAKIKNLNVTVEKLAPNAVTTDKLASGSVTANNLASDAVTTAKIKNSNVTAAKLADNAVSTVYTGTLTSAGWTGSAAPFTQTVNISGILATDIPIIDVIPSPVYAAAMPQIEDWGLIYRAVTNDGIITFYAQEKPTVALPFQARCIRK